VGNARKQRLETPTMRRIVLPLVALFVSIQVHAATMYISDQFTVPLRRGPSNGHKIVHAGLPSGMALEVLGEDEKAGFTHVRTPNGAEGWVPTQYLTGAPAAKDQLAAANRRIQTLEAELKSTRDNYQQARTARTVAETRGTDLTKQTEKLQAELAEIKRVSATSIAQYEENKQLKADNQRLQTEVTQLTERVRQLDRNVMLRWLLAGGGLVLIGLILGVWIKSRPRRSSWG
jgi:SH3 domain protein